MPAKRWVPRNDMFGGGPSRTRDLMDTLFKRRALEHGIPYGKLRFRALLAWKDTNLSSHSDAPAPRRGVGYQWLTFLIMTLAHVRVYFRRPLSSPHTRGPRHA